MFAVPSFSLFFQIKKMETKTTHFALFWHTNPLGIVQQAYNATAVIRQMRHLVLTSTSSRSTLSSGEDNNSSSDRELDDQPSRPKAVSSVTTNGRKWNKTKWSSVSIFCSPSPHFFPWQKKRYPHMKLSLSLSLFDWTIFIYIYMHWEYIYITYLYITMERKDDCWSALYFVGAGKEQQQPRK